jgi:hypothetical protein
MDVSHTLEMAIYYKISSEMIAIVSKCMEDFLLIIILL